MDETLKQILLELKRLSDSQERTEGHIERMDGRIDSIEGRMDRFEGRMDRLENEVKVISFELGEVKAISQATFEQVGMLTEFRTEINNRMDSLCADIIPRHERVLERLSMRSIKQEADILDLKPAK